MTMGKMYLKNNKAQIEIIVETSYELIEEISRTCRAVELPRVIE